MKSRTIVLPSGDRISFDCENNQCSFIGYERHEPIKNEESYWIQSHRDDGPAVFRLCCNPIKVNWYLFDRDVTSQVEQWIKDSNIRPWTEWTTQEKTLFKLRFHK